MCVILIANHGPMIHQTQMLFEDACNFLNRLLVSMDGTVTRFYHNFRFNICSSGTLVLHHPVRPVFLFAASADTHNIMVGHLRRS